MLGLYLEHSLEPVGGHPNRNAAAPSERHLCAHRRCAAPPALPLQSLLGAAREAGSLGVCLKVALYLLVPLLSGAAALVSPSGRT